MEYLLPAIGVMIGLLGAVFGFILSLSREVSSINTTVQDHAKQLEALSDLKRDMDRVTYRLEYQDAHAVDTLHSPTHERRDSLSERLLQRDLTRDELEELLCALREAKRHERNADKRWAAMMLMARVESELREKEA